MTDILPTNDNTLIDMLFYAFRVMARKSVAFTSSLWLPKELLLL